MTSTGIEASSSERCQHQNKRIARAVLEARVAERYRQAILDGKNSSRKAQIGSGERGDKIRTYRQQDDTVIDHRSGHKTRYAKFSKGILPAV